jgi:hypothetical protein
MHGSLSSSDEWYSLIGGVETTEPEWEITQPQQPSKRVSALEPTREPALARSKSPACFQPTSTFERFEPKVGLKMETTFVFSIQ